MMPLEVLSPGPATTVQDLGRPGHGAYGVPAGGAMDRGLLSEANRRAGNRAGAPALEFALKSPRLRWRGRAPLRCVLAADAVSEIILAPGDDLAATVLRGRAYGYVAVGGGFDVPLVMGGRGTCLPGGFGGFEGRTLRAGDRLAVGVPSPGSRAAGNPKAPGGDGSRSPGRAGNSSAGSAVSVRILPGDRPSGRSAAYHSLLGTEWRVESGDRVGLRLDGQQLHARSLHLSQPIPPGAVQVTGAGQPILLLRDHPTVGGYPVVAVVVADDLDAACQVRPGTTVQFRQARA